MGVRQHFLLGEVQIVHNMPDYPPYMGFSTGGAADFIVEGLKRFGYPVEEGGAGIVGVPFLQKLHWPSIIGPAAASVFAVVLAVLFKTRSLPFLRPPTIVSAGRVVPTEEFSAFCARIFLISAVVFAVMTAVLIGIQLWQRRKANSG